MRRRPEPTQTSASFATLGGFHAQIRIELRPKGRDPPPILERNLSTRERLENEFFATIRQDSGEAGGQIFGISVPQRLVGQP